MLSFERKYENLENKFKTLLAKIFLVFIVITSFKVYSVPKLFPGYLGDKVSPAWAINAGKWVVSIDDRSSNQLFAPTLHITCRVEKKKPDFCFTPDYDPNPGHAACMDIVPPGLDLWFSFEAHPNDPKPAYSYSLSGLFRLLFGFHFINRPVSISAGSGESFEGHFARDAVSTLVNTDYQAGLKRPLGRQWLNEFQHTKKVHISGKDIEIKATFWHQDLDRWIKETLEKCP